MKPQNPVFIFALLAGFASSCSQTPQPQKAGFFSSVHSELPLTASLTFDLKPLLQDKELEPEVDGTLFLDLAQPLHLPVEIKCRGERRKSLCDFPPLRIQLKKAAVAEQQWGPYRNYKLVTHCSDTLRDEELLLREYLVYKMYESMTELSLRTQLLHIRYILPDDTLHRFAFLIENEREMNDRLGLREWEPGEGGLKSIHYEHYRRFVLFQYMVGNTDWNVGTGHNTKYVLAQDSKVPIAIPYDFDYCGLVNASYAQPYHTLPLTHVRERYLMYRGKKGEDFSDTVDEFLAHKTQWYTLIDEFEHLSDTCKADVRNYLDNFFHLLEQPDWKDLLF